MPKKYNSSKMPKTNTKTKTEEEDWKSLDKRTPLRLQAMEPDVTVIVGGIEFHHYKAILAAGAPFFDNMLSSHMKESKTNVIEFPDKDPQGWLELYKIFDQSQHRSIQQRSVPIIHGSNADALLLWFDFLGMDEHLKEADMALAKCFDRLPPPPGELWELWLYYKHMPQYPETRKGLLFAAKKYMHAEYQTLTSFQKELTKGFDIQNYLLDDECGDEMWNYFTSSVVNLPHGMAEDLNREDILPSPLFKYVAKANRKATPEYMKLPARAIDIESSSEDESSDDEFPENGLLLRLLLQPRDLDDPSLIRIRMIPAEAGNH